MSKSQVYEMLPYDLSGSRSKNRFRNELLWGLEKLYEIYKTGEDFCIIFDYACDIEVHFTDRFEFYQIKTSNKGAPYTVGKIVNPDKQGNSILGKVYILKKIIDDSNEFGATKIAVVVNVPLKTLDETIHSSIKELELNTIKDVKEAKAKDDRNNGVIETQSKNKIIEKLKEEMKSSNIELDNVYYITSSLDLINPEETLLGATLNFIEEITGREAIKVKTLYRILTDIISEKACYELKCKNYDEVEQYKGITRDEFKSVLNRTINISNTYIKEAKYLIENNYTGYFEQVRLLKGLTSIVTGLTKSIVLSNLKDRIIEYIDTNIDNLPAEVTEIIDSILEVFADDFPIEYSKQERMALIVLMLAKYKEDSNE